MYIQKRWFIKGTSKHSGHGNIIIQNEGGERLGYVSEYSKGSLICTAVNSYGILVKTCRSTLKQLEKVYDKHDPKTEELGHAISLLKIVLSKTGEKDVKKE